MNKDPLIFIRHILEAIGNIESFSRGISREKFDKDKLIQSAIIRQIEVIGEAVKNVPVDFTNKHPNIEWKKIAGTRDKIIHHYFGIDLDTVWDVIEKDLPKLKKDIKKLLEENKNE
ncbi:DUF86 domain-containing protein [Candidatus Woesearchaeota archaeon]|nr:DUF86 domain-containing protein [Candidatus Woesearchaeota archaeon]